MLQLNNNIDDPALPIHLKVMDHDTLSSDDFLGDVQLLLVGCSPMHETQSLTLQLSRHAKRPKASRGAGDGIKGSILCEVTWHPLG